LQKKNSIINEHCSVLTEFSHQLNGIISLYEEFTDIEPRLQKVRRDIFAPIAQSLGWQVSGNEPELNRLLRVLAISEAGLAGDTDVIAEAKKRYAVFVEQKTLEVILPDLRSTVYKIVLKYAANEEEENQRWEEIYSIYNNEAYPMDQRITALTTLGSGIKSERVIDKTLALILDEQNIRTQDAWMTFRS
jgi:aminopeptidase 2